MTGLVVVGLGGAAGAVSRHLLDVGLRRRYGIGPSYGVLVANVVGSLVLGVLTGLTTTRTVDPQLRLLVATGFCGGLTTFSTLMAELVNLVEGDDEHAGAWPALGWALVSLVLGVGAAAVGWTLGSRW